MNKLKNTIYLNIFCILLLLIMSCSNQSTEQFYLKEFSPINILKFNKKNVKFSTSFNFLNDSEKGVTILKSDFDIYINGKDISSHINNSAIIVPAKRNFEIPIKVEFEPSKVFTNYKKGLVKIKSDIIATVKISGTLLIAIDSKEKEIEYADEQAVLFTNNNKIK
jgi:hypothetical protein